MPDTSTGVVVIGGGSTGAGVLRDLTLRGIDAILVEKGDLASGTTGRSHGLLHSGGRYCVNDEQAAIECVEEGRILRRIARSTVEDTGGYSVSATAEDQEGEPKFVEGCRRTGITCERISLDEARRREPALSKQVRTVFWVPEDGHLDPFYLVVGNVESARRRGARVMTHTEVSGFLREGDRLTGVRIRDSKTNEGGSIACQSFITAPGAWAGFVARLLGVEVKVVPVKGTMVVLSRRLAHAAINRCHKPGDGDIVVHGLRVSILGTTSVKVPHPETLPIAWDEVRRMIEEGAMMLDGVTTARAMRAYAGVRPLYDLGAEAEGREMSRNFAVIDHQERDGIAGFTSIVGGKVTTYRLMAEGVPGLVARRVGAWPGCHLLLPARGTPGDRPCGRWADRDARDGGLSRDPMARRPARLLGKPAAPGAGYRRAAPRTLQRRPPANAGRNTCGNGLSPSPARGGGAGRGRRDRSRWRS